MKLPVHIFDNKGNKASIILREIGLEYNENMEPLLTYKKIKYILRGYFEPGISATNEWFIAPSDTSKSVLKKIKNSRAKSYRFYETHN